MDKLVALAQIGTITITSENYVDNEQIDNINEYLYTVKLTCDDGMEIVGVGYALHNAVKSVYHQMEVYNAKIGLGSIESMC